jgi:hypothetical protein
MRSAISMLFVAAGLLQLAGVRPVRRAYARWGYPEMVSRRDRFH